NGLLKDKESNFEGNDIREGLVSIISVKIPEGLLQFEGQTKSKLGTPQARQIVDNIVSSFLVQYFDLNSNEITNIIEKAKRLRVQEKLQRKLDLSLEKVNLLKKIYYYQVNLHLHNPKK
ncbi:MAG: hypothetical protein ACK5HS_03785, partial [Mycoplasmatales bacterium]